MTKVKASRTRDVVVDIETMGDVANSVILSIGAASVDLHGDNYDVGETLYLPLPFAEQFALGRVSTIGTMNDFWTTVNDPEATDVFRQSALTTVDCRAQISKLTQWIEAVGGEDAIVHGCGPSFDNAIIRNLCDDLGVPLPWKFRNEGCLRTALRVVPNVRRVKSRIPHHALEDAIAEARTLCAIQAAVGVNSELRFVALKEGLPTAA